MEDDRLIDCGGIVVGGEAFVTFNPRNFYWNNDCIILPKSVDLPQVSGCISGQPTSGNTFRVNPKYAGPVTRTAS